MGIETAWAVEKKEGEKMIVEGRKALEQHLLSILGEENLKEIGEQLAEIVVRHGLQQSPELCEDLFLYFSSVIFGWNSEQSGQ